MIPPPSARWLRSDASSSRRHNGQHSDGFGFSRCDGYWVDDSIRGAWRRNAALAGGFIAGAAIGAAAANAIAGYYSGAYGYDSYAYAPGYSSGYDSYAYEPAYAAPVYTPPRYYGPVTTYQSTYPGYDTNYIGPWRERQLQGRD